MKNTNLILGKIGIGKTSVMFDELDKIIEKKENLVVVDNKEEYYKNYARKLKENGYNVYVINYNNASKSNGFNPLLLPYKFYKNSNKDVAVKMVQSITVELLKNDAAIDPFWYESAANYLSGLMLTLFNNAKEDEINFGSIQMMISQIEKTKENNEKFKEYINNLDLLNQEYILLSGTALAPVETRSGIISVLKMELNKYITTENLLNLLCLNELDLNSVKEKTAIFIIGNSDYCKLTNVLLNEIITASEINNTSFNYILDNSDTLSSLTKLNDLLETAVIKNQKVYLMTRNIDELTSKYGKFISDKFESVIEINEEKEYKERDNYSEYPSLNASKNNYFNFMNILSNE